MAEETEVQTASVNAVEAMANGTTNQEEVLSNLKQILGEGDDGTYNIISSNGWTEIKLKKPLTEDSEEDYDEDGLYDWNEVNTTLIYNMYAKNNHSYTSVIRSSYLPKLSDCKAYYTDVNNHKIYVESGYEAFENYMRAELLEDGIPEDYIDDEINKIRILPIISDPTSPDSDGDGYLDSILNENFIEAKYNLNGYVDLADPMPLYSNVIKYQLD